LAAAFRLYGLPYIIFRPHNVYGEHQNLGDPYRNVLGIFMNQIMAGRPLPVFGDGEQTRAFSYIDDVAPHIARSVYIEQAYNQVFNIGAIQPYTVNHLARVIIEAFGVEALVEHLPAREEVYHVYPSLDKAIRLLNAEPRIGLEEGVRRMAAWARRTGSRTSKVFSDIEVSLKLPPYWASLTEVPGR
jgi:UDP-glucose 4-epimerase